MNDVSDWLEGLGLGAFAGVFAENMIDMETLPHLVEDDLRELGLPMGPRKKILAEIARLSAPPQAPAAAPAPTHAPERRQLTVAFVDLVGSSALSYDLDPEDFRAVMQRYHDVVSVEARRFDGYVAKFLGDGVLIYFGYPSAHEDDAARAVRASLAILAAVGRERAGDVPLGARIGVATGMVVVGDQLGEGASREEAVIGATPNLAARLQQAASVGSAVIAQSTADLLGRQFQLTSLPPQDLKGFPEPVACYRVEAEQVVASRFDAYHGAQLGRFVGRDEELALLTERWARARDREGQVVLLSGEAGIGKSRLVKTLIDTAAADRHVRLRLQCSSQHVSTALHPFAQQIERAAEFMAADDAPAKRVKLTRLLERSATDIAAAVDAVSALLSVPIEGTAPPQSPQQRREQVLDVLLEQLTGLARSMPVLVVFEDAHWADPTSLELLERIIDAIADLPVLLVVTARPEFTPPWPEHAHLTSLKLNRLSKRQVREIVTELTAEKGLDPETVAEIIARTDGVPLFVEELTKAVIETDAGKAGGERLQPQYIPSSLQDSLMARLDRLAPAKELAQVGAAIGREFPYRLLAAVAGLDEERLATALEALCEADLILRRGTPEGVTYVFKHALMQDTAYKSLVKEKRQALHGRIANGLQKHYPERIQVEPEILAHHLTEAGMAAEAVPHWLAAGKRSLERSADLEAIQHLRAALALIEPLPESAERHRWELEALIALANATMNTAGSGSQEVYTLLMRARPLAGKVGSDEHAFTVEWGLWLHHTVAGRIAEASVNADRTLALSERLEDTGFRLQAHHAAWTSCSAQGDLAEVMRHTEEGWKLYDPDRHGIHAYIYGGHDAGVCAGQHMAVAAWFLGRPDVAEMCRRTIALARKVDHIFSTLHVLSYFAILELLDRSPDRALPLIDEVMELSQRHGLPVWVLNARILRGWALCETGRAAEVLEDYRAAIDARQAAGSKLRQSLYLASLARSLSRAGEHSAAVSYAELALEQVEGTGERAWETFVRWVHGGVVRNAGGSGAAERAADIFRQTIAVAQSQGARAMELRAAVSLGTLLLEQGMTEGIRQMIEPLRDSFAKGFTSPDIDDAGALLARLGD